MLRSCALGLVVTALVAASGPVRAEEPAAPTLVLSDAVITAGQTATLSGSATPGTTVSLFGWSSPSTTYALQRQGTADADGTYRFAVAPSTNSRYYAAADSGAASTAVALPVRTAVVLDPVAVTGDTLDVSGRLLPRAAATVSIVLTRDGESSVAGTAPADRTGFRTTLTSPRRGAFAVTATVPATRDNLAGASAPQQVVLTPAQAAAGSPG